jgi:hypothetical protein
MWGDGGASDADAILGDGMRGTHRHLIVGLAVVFDAEHRSSRVPELA